MSKPNQRGPRVLSEILGDLFASRGFGRLSALKELEEAWKNAVGEPGWRQTQLGEVRRGVLNVTVASSALLEELSAFQKPTILAALRKNAPGTVVHDIRFRVGPIDSSPVSNVVSRPQPDLNASPRASASRPRPTRKKSDESG